MRKDDFVNACKYGHSMIVEFFLKQDQSQLLNQITIQEAFYEAFNHGHCDIVKQLLNKEQYIKKEDIVRAIYTASECGYVDIFQYLLETNSDVPRDVYPLERILIPGIWNQVVQKSFHKACMYGKENIVQLILSLTGEYRIDVKYNNSEAFRSMFSAYIRDSHKVLELFLNLSGDRYMDVHINDDELFYSACEHSHVNDKSIQLLLELTGERTISQSVVETAFLKACEMGQENAVKLCMQYRTIPTELIQTGITIAIDNDNHFISEELVEKETFTYKPTSYKCQIMKEPIMTGDKYVECVVNPEHVFDYNLFKKTPFKTCCACKTIQVKYYVNANEEQ
jgi:hypothetical protein